MATVGNAQKRISKNTVCEYKLLLSINGYSIECTEYDNYGSIKDFSAVKNITYLKETAQEIFQKVVKHRVCACTLYDVISDLIC